MYVHDQLAADWKAIAWWLMHDWKAIASASGVMRRRKDSAKADDSGDDLPL